MKKTYCWVCLYCSKGSRKNWQNYNVALRRANEHMLRFAHHCFVTDTTKFKLKYVV